jgi:superfamily II DNA/RNA helicase
LICCETTSTRQKKGLFTNGKVTVTTGMLVTPKFLVWTSGEEKGKPVVLSALLRNIVAHEFENTAMYRVAPDSGLNISGRYTDVTKQGQTFMGLGADPAGEKCGPNRGKSCEETISVLIFTRTKHRASRLQRQIKNAGYKVTSLHSDRTQGQRQSAPRSFKRGRNQSHSSYSAPGRLCA